MRSAQIAVTLALLAAIAGCRETHHCGPGESYQSGVCLPRPGMGPDASADAGMDGGHAGGDDMGVDATTDAGRDAPDPCDFCGAGHCYSPDLVETGTIDAGSAHVCVACTEDSHCAAVIDAAVMDGGIGDDAGVRGQPICLEFQCRFGCHTDAECGPSGVCRPDHRCSEYPRYAIADVACAPCDTDGNCSALPQHLCLHYVYQNGGFTDPGPGNFCLYHGSGCGSSAPPLADWHPSAPAASIDGLPVPAGDDVCVGRTSCQAITDANAHRPCSGTAFDCGIEGVNDGSCQGSVCTYGCVAAEDCPQRTNSCVGAPAYCL